MGRTVKCEDRGQWPTPDTLFQRLRCLAPSCCLNGPPKEASSSPLPEREAGRVQTRPQAPKPEDGLLGGQTDGQTAGKAAGADLRAASRGGHWVFFLQFFLFFYTFESFHNKPWVGVEEDVGPLVIPVLPARTP